MSVKDQRTGDREMSTTFKNNGEPLWKSSVPKIGRPKLFMPKELLQKVQEYFQWIDEHAYYEQDYVGKDGREVAKRKLRPYTLEGLCIFLGVNTLYFRDLEKSIAGKDDEESASFSQVCAYARDVIRDQQVSGAASGFLNPVIVARLNGLVDKAGLEHSGEIVINQDIVVRSTGIGIASSESDVQL